MSHPTDPRLVATVQAAVAAGLLPAGTAPAPINERPWPVILLTALGAWLAAVPLLLMVGMLLGDLIQADAGPYIVGVLVLIGATLVMRSDSLPLFVEQLAVPALLVGGGTLALGVYRDLEWVGGSWVMLAVVLVLAVAIPKAWLRMLLGALAAGLLAAALLPESAWYRGRGSQMLVMHGLLAVWLLALWFQERASRWAALVGPLACGWVLCTLWGLVWLAGPTFLVGGVVGANEVSDGVGWITGYGPHAWQSYATQMGASALVLAGAGVGALAWPALRQLLPLAVAVVLAALAWFMPLLGATLLILMVSATTQRWRVASAAGVAAAWIVGSFYYQLQWPLADKATVLVVAAALLGALVWVSHRTAMAPSAGAVSDQPTRTLTPSAWALLAGSVLTLVVANGAIWQKQQLIAKGTPLFLALEPVDPRSLMEGDYMRLRFPTVSAQAEPLLQSVGAERPHMVVRVDAQGVGKVERLHTPGQPLAAGEQLLELTPKDGSWVVVTDAWYFKEGEAARWQAARFGEFRVLPDGRALLVGMADANLKPITP